MPHGPACLWTMWTCLPFSAWECCYWVGFTRETRLWTCSSLELSSLIKPTVYVRSGEGNEGLVFVCLSAESRFCYQQVSVQHEAIGQLKEQWITIPQSRKHNWVSNIYILCLAMERGFIKSCCVRLSRISNLLLILKPKLRMEPLSGHMQDTSVKLNYFAVISQLNACIWNSSLKLSTCTVKTITFLSVW